MKERGRQAGDRLISGKLREKAARDGAARRIVSVDGTDYAWAYRHGFLVWGKDIKAISISVSLNPGRTRELIVDLTLTMKGEHGEPSEARILRALQPAIRSARESGWDPESRGRAVRYQIKEHVS